MKKLTLEQQKEALNNALRSFNFDSKYKIVVSAPLFCIGSKNQAGGLNTHTRFMSYENMNAFLMGYNTALTKPL